MARRTSGAGRTRGGCPGQGDSNRVVNDEHRPHHPRQRQETMPQVSVQACVEDRPCVGHEERCSKKQERNLDLALVSLHASGYLAHGDTLEPGLMDCWPIMRDLSRKRRRHRWPRFQQANFLLSCADDVEPSALT